MASTFHDFSRLSAELRASVWKYALDCETHSDEPLPGRAIEFLDYDPSAGTIAVSISSPYPVLFAVNREARYESAKIQGGEWVPVHVNHASYTGTSRDNGFDICINFSIDNIELSERFLSANMRDSWSVGMPTPENYRLNVLSQILDLDKFKKIETLVISANPPGSAHRLETNAWWRGEGLGTFYPGHLKNVIVSITAQHNHKSDIQDYAVWLQSILEDELEKRWVIDGWESHHPVVSMDVIQNNEA
ncbi:hypothetical protein P153DRAFT_357454 [Dothidotthia symphoricarpi CBS 119687]|uniref:2EXR domain-containing protein n=1 Tax=Dothidotthia symphoricarpi CBS 119687 TaxID=1392245 RepID=A0A6A6ACK7_9PLEO|nr:uncharacterized protein P153DRAFT_357454 [Dothidotthia symphoricarpi CBS 119687]KAF2128973.1 hypothetical protein P153DRAFT_357454 [Dothidotthia symphoricarpi CBS 119687]